jgi:hypothetical protein
MADFSYKTWDGEWLSEIGGELEIELGIIHDYTVARGANCPCRKKCIMQSIQKFSQAQDLTAKEFAGDDKTVAKKKSYVTQKNYHDTLENAQQAHRDLIGR